MTHAASGSGVAEVSPRMCAASLWQDDELSPFHPTDWLRETLSVATVAAISFGSTNLDNLAVVSAYSAKSGARPLFVKLTFVVVCLTVLLASLALAEVAAAMPEDKIRYLGLIPMTIGAYHLAKLIMRKLGAGGAGPKESSTPIGAAGYVGLGFALLANSSDSVIVMTPLLADLKFGFVATSFAAAVAMAIAMSTLANTIARHPAWGGHVERISEWALPFVLIGIGALIFANAS